MSGTYTVYHDTMVSWYTVYVPLNLMLNALGGGPLLAIAGLRAAGYEPVEGRMGRALTMVSIGPPTSAFSIKLSGTYTVYHDTMVSAA